MRFSNLENVVGADVGEFYPENDNEKQEYAERALFYFLSTSRYG
jgi:hypothetical protein